MLGYRNAYYNPKEQSVELFTWAENGERITTTVNFKPYIYLEDQRGTSTSIYNTKLKKKSFDTYWDKLKFLKESGIRRVFENFNPTQQCLMDLYCEHNETEEFSKFPLKIYFIDIEVAVKNEFPHADRAEHPMDVVTIYNNFDKKFYIWGMRPYQTTNPDVVYKHCTTEKELLYDLIDFINTDSPDIISGWNSAFFDIPYIINRINNVLGENAAHKLSPCGKTYFRTSMGKFGKMQTKWFIDGISCVDYLDIYTRFIFKNQESYKLSHVGEVELGESKVDIGNMDLFTLKETDWQKFVDYNIQDVNLLARLEQKLQFIPLLRMLAYVGTTTLEAAMGTLSIITGAAAIRARKRGQRIVTVLRNETDKAQVPGAYVAPPLQGFQESIFSVDATSLYPSIMISLNMSPETKVGKIIDKTAEHVVVKHVNGQQFKLTHDKFVKFIKDGDIAITKAKVLFSQKTKGIVPDLVDYYFKERVKTRKEHKKIKRECELLEAIEPKDEAKINAMKDKMTQLNAKQLCIKIFINACYGYFANASAPMGDDDIAASITLTGQAVIKKSGDIAKEYATLKCVENELDIIDEKILDTLVIYNDTDSCYITLKPILDKLKMPFLVNGKINKEVHKIIEEFNEKLNTDTKRWMETTMNSKDCRIEFKRESIADVGIFLRKKRYVIHVLDDEGFECDKWKYTGVDVARTTMPKVIKPYVKKIIETMLTTKNLSETNKVLNEAYEVFKALPPNEISFLKGIKNYDKYVSQCKEFQTAKRMPIHVKSAYFHNMMLERYQIGGQYEKIADGDKTRFYYVKQPNKYKIESIGFKYVLPDEFAKEFPIDKEKMFDKIVFAAIINFYTAVNWQPRKPNDQVVLDILEYFS